MTVKKDECALFYHIFLFLVPVGLIQNNIIKICWYGMLACSMAVILLNVIAQKRHIMKGVLPYMLFYLLFQTIATYKSNGNWKYGVCTLIVVCTFIIFIQVQVELDFGRLLTVLDIAIEVQILMELILYIFGIDFLQSLACSYLYYCVWGTLHLVRLQDRGKRDLHIYFISFLYLFAFFIVPEINTDGTVNYEWTFFIVLAFMCSLYFFRKLTYKMWKTLNINTIYLYILGFNIMFVIVQNFTKIPGINYILGELCRVYEEAADRGILNAIEPHTTSLYLALGKRLWFSQSTAVQCKITHKADWDMFEGYLLLQEKRAEENKKKSGGTVNDYL